MRIQERQLSKSGFTLVELLVVISIILLASLVAIPTLVTNLNGRQVTDAARIFTGALVGARDSAIKYNSPRGIRLLPDPVLTIPAIGTAETISGKTYATAGINQLCYNRMIAIEPAGDYSEGRITIGPYYPTDPPPAAGSQTFPPQYPMPPGTASRYPFPPSADPMSMAAPRVLRVEESPYAGGFVSPNAQPNAPTNWYWNIRVGDKLKIGGTGRAYTVVGPCTINPWSTDPDYRGNPELFCNVGAPGESSMLVRTYYQMTAAGGVGSPWPSPMSPLQPEYLFLVNGEDDDGDGYVDSGWDGFDNNGDGAADENNEWEVEKWIGSVSTGTLADVASANGRPSESWAAAQIQTGNGTQDVPYIIERRPVPSQGAREVMLPAGMVIDATTGISTPARPWSRTRERSRIPISPGSLYCDIMVNPNGLYIPTTEYSTPTSAQPSPFLHFWITDRNDVHPVGTLWQDPATGLPIANPNKGQTYLLPMPSDTAGYPANAIALKNDRRLVTMFTQSGLVVTNTIESIASPNLYQPGEGFNVNDVGFPFYKAQIGQREAR